MARPRGMFGYIKAAFNARPFGMFVAPNWLGLAAFGVAGFVNPGFWLIGAGVELFYLFTLATNRRFQRAVSGDPAPISIDEWRKKQDALIARLSDTDQARYVAFVARCRAILDQFEQQDASGSNAKLQGENLGKLTWVYLRLLLARRTLSKVLKEPTLGETQELESRLNRLREQLQSADVSEDLRRSLTSQADILEQRVAQRREGREKLEFLEAEIMRINEQVELLREQAAISTDADGLSARLDAVAGTIGGATQWMAEQQKLLGSMDDLMQEPPPLVARASARERA
jgi:hypothetical protein